MSKNVQQHRGKLGEQLASEFLTQKGFRVLEMNWHSQYAEIDIVCIDGDTLVFVEVKTRFDDSHGSPEEAMTPHKISTLTRAAYLYSSQHPELPDRLRIDFVGIDYASGTVPRINHIPNITV